MPRAIDRSYIIDASEGLAHSNSFYDLDETYAERTAQRGRPPLLEDFIERLGPNNQVIDLGCGAGRELATLRAAGFDCRGFDLSPLLAKKAVALSGAQVTVADMRDLSFPDNSVGGVIAVASLLHLEQAEITLMLHRIKRWLVSSGPFLATMKLGQGAFIDAMGRRFTLYRENEWLDLLESAGFTVDIHAATSADRSISTSDHDWIATLASYRG